MNDLYKELINDHVIHFNVSEVELGAMAIRSYKRREVGFRYI